MNSIFIVRYADMSYTTCCKMGWNKLKLKLKLHQEQETTVILKLHTKHTGN
jgi:hypothetical protein